MMSTPAARVGDSTATGDTLIGPGIPTVMIGGKPASVMGDQIVGAPCTGSITVGSVNVQIGGKPAARVTSNCVGVNAKGDPSSTTVAVGEPTVLIS